MGTTERPCSYGTTRGKRQRSADSYWSQARATDDVVEWQMALPGQLQELLTAALITGSLGILADA